MAFNGINVRPLGNGQLTCGSATITKLTTSVIPANANAALIRPEIANVRWSDGTGSTLSGTIGLLMAVTDSPLEYVGTLSNMQFIPVGGTAATINLNYYQIFF
jgi:hypothetical protein